MYTKAWDAYLKGIVAQCLLLFQKLKQPLNGPYQCDDDNVNVTCP